VSGENARFGTLTITITFVGFTGNQKLNLAGIPRLRSIDLAGLLPAIAEQGHSPLETLILDNTGVDDRAALYISGCPMLGALEVAGTKFTSELPESIP